MSEMPSEQALTFLSAIMITGIDIAPHIRESRNGIDGWEVTIDPAGARLLLRLRRIVEAMPDDAREYVKLMRRARSKPAANRRRTSDS